MTVPHKKGRGSGGRERERKERGCVMAVKRMDALVQF